ncbi:MAG: TRAP transporter substrate-binding protein DctP [Spirochaetota bacterium]|nr:TRAP transporter substrate-binding protein DctP [Spirochaetota bacterium]
MMRRERFYILACVLSGLFIVGFCLSILMAEKKPKYIWKFGTLGQDTIKMVSILTVDLTGDILKVTNSELKCVWYMGGVMGDEEDYIAKMRINQLQGALITGTANAMACPGISVMELPFLFNNWDEVDYVRNRLRPKLSKIAEKNGFKLLFDAGVDFEHFYSTKLPMKTPEDFKKSKMLSWHGPLEVEVLKTLGASPIPVNVPEIVPSMRAGVVDSCISPSFWWLAAQLYTITKYINPLPIRYDPGVFIVSMSAWNEIPLEYRKRIMKLMPPLNKKINQELRKVCKDSYKAMITYGCKEVKMIPEEIEVFRKRTRPVWNKMIGKSYSKEMLDDVLLLLKKYRTKKKVSM